MKKILTSLFIATLFVCILALGASAEDSLTIDAVSFNVAQNTGSITFTIPQSLEGKSVTFIVRATNPADNDDTGIAYINQYDNVTAGEKTVTFTVRDTISYGIMTFYVGATDLDTPESDIKLYGILGDANKDGTTDVSDVTIMLRHLAKLDTLDASGIILANADMSEGENPTDVSDVTIILRYLAKLSVDTPVGQ